MEIHIFKVTVDGKIYLDDLELKNIKGFEITSPADSPAELVLKMDVMVGSIGSESEQ